MATIEKYAAAGGTTRYRVRYRTPERRQTDKRGFRTKRDAEAFAAAVESAKARGDYVANAASRITVGELYDEWSRGRTRVKATTRAKQASAWDTHVAKRWADVPAADVRTSSIRTWTAEMMVAGSGAATVESALGVLRGVLEAAAVDRRIPRNPCLGIKPPRRTHSRRGYLTHRQVAALAEAIASQPATFRGGRTTVVPRPEYGTIVRLLAYTGLRWGEMAALRVGDVNLTRRRLNITRAVAEVRGDLVYSTPKTHERRSVPFPPFLLDELEHLMDGKAVDELIFTGPQGAALRVSNFRPRDFLPAVARCQKADGTFPRVSPHDLRHTAASLAISAGANVKSVQRMLGHASAAMTLDTYADLFPDDLDDVATALGRAADSANETATKESETSEPAT